jgi:hypothetical protein
LGLWVIIVGLAMQQWGAVAAGVFLLILWKLLRLGSCGCHRLYPPWEKHVTIDSLQPSTWRSPSLHMRTEIFTVSHCFMIDYYDAQQTKQCFSVRLLSLPSW